MTKKLLAFKQAGVLQVKPPTANGPFNGSNGSTPDAPSLTRPSDAVCHVLIAALPHFEISFTRLFSRV